MSLRSRFTAGLAGQLARPHGASGRLVAITLNRHNRGTITAAVGLLAPDQGVVVADIGFGGGLSLSLLLKAISPDGTVLGVEISPVALRRAQRRFSDDVSAGRLRLCEAPITHLPIADGSLVGLMTVNTLYFVDELDVALRELARVVSDGGRIVVGLGDPHAMAAMPVTPHGFRLRPIAEVVDAMAGVGLDTIGHERVGDGDGAYHLLLASRTTPLARGGP